jgi:DNA-binding SARP family transcriptional activator
MLAYLAYRGDWVTRETLVGLFWPQRAEPEAQHNLRANLHRVKKLLANWGLAERMDAQWRRVRLNLPTDVAAFRRALASADWAQATQRHRAPLLADLSLPGFSSVDEWFAAERQVLLQGWHQAARQHAGQLLAAGDATAAFALLHQQLTTDLLAEDLVLALLRAARAVGERETALQHYERFRQRLRDELGLEPMAQTVTEVQRLRAAVPDGAPRPAADLGGTLHVAVPRLHAGPLTGRAAELRQLTEATRTIVVVGEPGVGKTRLLEEAWPKAIWFSCREDYQAEPLRPVADTFDDAIDALQSLPVVARWRSVLGHLVPALAAGEQPPPLEAKGGDQLMDAVVEVLAALDRPLVFDDLQWADAATLALLSQLVNPPVGPAPRLRVAAAARSDEIGLELHRRLDALEASGHLQRLPLPRLTPGDLGLWLQRLSGNAPAPAFANWLHARSGGNPFFALETLRALFTSGRLSTDSGQWAGDFEAPILDDAAAELPARTAALVRRRVERLSEPARRVLTIAALAGDARALEPLAQVAGLTPWALAEAITEAQQAELLVGRRFAHELVRESLISNTPEALQQVLHASIARHCGDRLAPHALAAHWWAAGEVSTAVTETLRAAARDCDCGWQDHASTLLRDALARTDAGDARARLTGALARTTMEQGDFARAQALALEALQALPAPSTRQQTLLLLADIALQQGQLDVAAQLHDEAAQIDPELPELWLLEGKIAFDRGDFVRNVDAHTRLLRLLRRRAPDTMLVLTLSALGAAHDALAQSDAAIACHREAMATARSLGARYAEVDAAVNLLWSLSEAGLHDEAIRIGEQGLAIGRYDATPALMNNLAWLYLDLERLAEAEALYRSLCDEADPTIRCFAWAKRVDIGARRGDRAAIDQAIEHALASLDATDLYRAHAVVIIATLEHGEPDAVSRAAQRLRNQPVDPFLQRRLDTLVARHGLDVAHSSEEPGGYKADH